MWVMTTGKSLVDSKRSQWKFATARFRKFISSFLEAIRNSIGCERSVKQRHSSETGISGDISGQFPAKFSMYKTAELHGRGSRSDA